MSDLKYNIIFVCDERLDELIVPNEDFQPRMCPINYANKPHQHWWIDATIMPVPDGQAEVPTSNFITKCPKCRRKDHVLTMPQKNT